MLVWKSFAELFDSSNILTVCLCVSGLILVSIEFFQPMRKICYALGASLICTAFVTHMINGSAGEAFAFVFLTCVVLFGVHIVALATQKRVWLSVARIERARSRRREAGATVGSEGVANTAIDLTGSVTVNEINLAVYSKTPIAAGERVRIVEVTPDRISVERIED